MGKQLNLLLTGVKSYFLDCLSEIGSCFWSISWFTQHCGNTFLMDRDVNAFSVRYDRLLLKNKDESTFWISIQPSKLEISSKSAYWNLKKLYVSWFCLSAQTELNFPLIFNNFLNANKRFKSNHCSAILLAHYK